MFPKKYCGIDFLNAFEDGRLKYDIKDTTQDRVGY